MGIGRVAGAQLVDDVDRLGRHSKLCHERVKFDQLLPVHARPRDQVIKLDAEHDLLVGVELVRQLLRHRTDIMLFLEGVPEKEAEFRVYSGREIVTQKTE